ncbi:NADH-cytochrome b5 reductase-like [Podila verticillata]|nr:NADH-cytochrome b5 reductase-like [Podila verticillata]
MNPAVAKWLEEIAAAKAKAEAQKATQEPSPSSLLDSPNQQQILPGTSQNTSTTPAPPAKSYGIVTSYNLRTRKKQLKLVLPAEPRKPGPGECCGNDCDPCINTLYYQDLEAHKQTVQELQRQYEQACRDLENGVTEPTAMLASSATWPKIQTKTREEVLDEEKGLSVRAYRPFKILKKQRLADNTLLIVCDTPSPSSVASSGKLSTFHILIRFQLPRSHSTAEDQDQKEQQQFVTKAFTPVDLPSSHGKLTFLVKLYPPPHRTSEMFRALQVWSPSSCASTAAGGLDEEKGVLYLRGPVRTGFDLDHLPIPGQQLEQMQRRSKRRVVMIAAGSGVTPMYQILQQYHAELMARRDREEEEEEEEGEEQRQEQAQDQVELDLIYCNRTRADIWLRQELHSFSKPVRKETVSKSGDDVGVRTFVRVQHILSSTDMSPSDLVQPSDQDDGRDQSEEQSVATSSGRVTPQILQETLRSHYSAWKVETSSADMAALSLEEEEEEPVQIVICGPEAFNRDVVAMLAQLGHSNESGCCVIHVLE